MLLIQGEAEFGETSFYNILTLLIWPFDNYPRLQLSQVILIKYPGISDAEDMTENREKNCVVFL